MNFSKFINSGLSRFSEYEKNLKDCQNASISTIGDHEFPIYKATINPDLEKSIYLIGSIHGNEIAGTTGLLDYLRKGIFPQNIRVEVIPLLNTSGFINNTRNNHNDVDINRDLCKAKMQPETESLLNLFDEDKPNMAWTLHEDNSCDKFYAYYSDDSLLGLWKNLVNLASKYFPIMHGDIHGDNCENGLIRHPEQHIVIQQPKHECSIENALYKKGIHYLTTETPCNCSLSKRTLCYRNMLNHVLHHLDNNKVDQI